MSSLAVPPLPASLKGVAHYLKTATEHEKRDPVVTYWSRLAAVQIGMKLDRTSKESTAVLIPLMDWLEREKKALADNEAITSEVVASAHLENYALRLFTWADGEDRAGKSGKNVVKAFYTAGMLFDVLEVVVGSEELTPENAHARKYAKWKAAYIHNCLKNGETPVPGPVGGPDEGSGAAPVAPGGWQAPQIPPDGGAENSPQSQEPTPKPVPSPRANVPPAAVPPAASAVIAASSKHPPPAATALAAPTSSTLTQEQTSKAQKYCKYAASALDYDDKAAAIDNLQKALRLLETGQDS